MNENTLKNTIKRIESKFYITKEDRELLKDLKLKICEIRNEKLKMQIKFQKNLKKTKLSNRSKTLYTKILNEIKKEKKVKQKNLIKLINIKKNNEKKNKKKFPIVIENAKVKIKVRKNLNSILPKIKYEKLLVEVYKYKKFQLEKNLKILLLRIYSFYHIEPVQNNLIKKILEEKKFIYFKQMIIVYNLEEIHKKQKFLDVIKKNSIKEKKKIKNEEKNKLEKCLDKVSVQNIKFDNLKEKLEISKTKVSLQIQNEKNDLYFNSIKFIENSDMNLNYVIYYLYKNNIKNFKVFYYEFLLEKNIVKKKKSNSRIKSLRNIRENKKTNIIEKFERKNKNIDFHSTLSLKKNNKFRSTFTQNNMNKNLIQNDKKRKFLEENKKFCITKKIKLLKDFFLIIKNDNNKQFRLIKYLEFEKKRRKKIFREKFQNKNICSKLKKQYININFKTKKKNLKKQNLVSYFLFTILIKDFIINFILRIFKIKKLIFKMTLDIGYEIISYKLENGNTKKINFFDNLITYRDNILKQKYKSNLKEFKNYLKRENYDEMENFNNNKEFIYTVYYFKNYLNILNIQKNLKVIKKKKNLKINKLNNKNTVKSSNRLKSKNFNLRNTILSKFQNKNPLIYLSMDKILKNNKIKEKNQTMKRVLKKYKKRKLNPLITKKFVCKSKNKIEMRNKIFTKIDLLLKYEEKVQKKKGILKNNDLNSKDLTNKDITNIFNKERASIENQIRKKKKLRNSLLPKFKKINHKRNSSNLEKYKNFDRNLKNDYNLKNKSNFVNRNLKNNDLNLKNELNFVNRNVKKIDPNFENQNENLNRNLGFSLRLGLDNIRSQSKLISKIHKLDCRINERSSSILERKNPFSFLSTNTYHLKNGSFFQKLDKNNRIVYD